MGVEFLACLFSMYEPCHLLYFHVIIVLVNSLVSTRNTWSTIYFCLDYSQVYSEENKTPFPEDVAELTDVIAEFLGYENFKAEAAIVNYYHMNSTLSAHTDHSEVNLEAPLFSFRCVASF